MWSMLRRAVRCKTEHSRALAKKPAGLRRRRHAFEALEPRQLLTADSMVVFNEIMYHPAGGDRNLQWIELFNQMQADMDLSGWSLSEAVDFEFAKGTVLPGGGYLVVAANPSALQAATGFASALGPFTGDLSATGEWVVLRNNSNRLMDEIQYGSTQPWPESPDGSGTSLAKSEVYSASSPAENWRASEQIGGTPGRLNFAPATGPVSETLVGAGAAARVYVPTDDSLDTRWTQLALGDAGWQQGTIGVGYDTDSLDPSAPRVQRYYPWEGNASDQSGNSVNAVVTGAQYSTDVPAAIGAGKSLRFNGIADYAEVVDGLDPAAYTLSAWVKLDTVRATSIIVRTNSSGPTAAWSHQLRVTSAGTFEHYTFDGGSRAVTGTTAIQAGKWYHVAAVAVDNGPVRLYVNGVAEGTSTTTGTMWRDGDRWQIGSNSGATPNFFAGSIDEVGIWHEALSPAQIALLAAGGSPMALGGYGSLIQTDIKSAMYGHNASAYVRIPFSAADPSRYAQLTLKMKYDDGFVVYLNGEPVARRNAEQSPQWNASATAEHPDGEAMVFEQIDLTEHLGKLRAGNNLLAIHGLNSSPTDTDFLLVPELTAKAVTGTKKLVFSEVTAGAQHPFWLELTNAGSAAINVNGHMVRSSSGGQYVLQDGALAPGEYLVLSEAQLGFTPNVGEKLFLFGPGASAVADAITVADTLRGTVASDPRGTMWYPSAATPGTTNIFAFHDEVVINEIMYHHAPQYGEEYDEIDEEWIELYNRSDHAVDLSGWRLADAVDFVFPQATILPADGYLVISSDAAALKAKYPGIAILGNFARDLSDLSDHIVLLDAAGNPADDVRYYERDPWPSYADGDGSSLELRDPFADNSRPEAWAASDETGRSTWQHYSYTMAAINPVYSPTIYSFHEFRLGLLNDGEALIDNVTVVENPSGAARQLIQNTTFTTGSTRWRLLGNHGHSQVVTDPNNSDNKVLHVVATGQSSYLNNLIETTLKFNNSLVPVVAGVEYQISFDAKWLAGSPQLRTELYYNKVAKTTILDMPDRSGTPGQRNSAFQANVGPTYSGLNHSPAVPKAGEPISVSVAATDPQGIVSMTLRYSVGGGAWQSLAMTRGAGDTYAATIPGQTAASVIQFYVEGTDQLGVKSTYPADGVNSRALIKVDDGYASKTKQNIRIIMTPADALALHDTVNMLSNDRRGATVVYNETQVFYDARIRLRGSMFSRQNPSTVGFFLDLPADNLFRGVHDTISVERPQISEILVKHMITSAGGIPALYDDIVHLVTHRSDNMGPARLSMSRFDDSMSLESQFQTTDDGTVFEMEGIRVFQTTNTGDPEGIKLGQPVGWVSNFDIQNLGNDKEQYRWSILIKNNRDRDDYSQLIAMAQAFSLNGKALEEAVADTMDVDEWMRTFAMASLAGIGDMYTQGNPHNILFYVRPDNGKVMALPWDWDFTFNYPTNNSLWGNQNLSKIISLLPYRRLFYDNLRDLISSTYNTAYMSRWLTHYGQLTGESYAGVGSYIAARASYVLSQLPAQIPFEVTTNGGVSFSVNDVAATIEGSAWINVHEIRLAGQTKALKPDWTDDRHWKIVLPVDFGANTFTFEAYDRDGRLLSSDAINVTSTVQDRPLPNSLRITEINYNPSDPTDSEIEQGITDNNEFEFVELQNIGLKRLDVTGVKFSSGINFEFTGTYAGASVLITEAGTATPDWVEIQNVSPDTVDTNGWVVATNHAQDSRINDVTSVVWRLPATMSSRQVLYRTDNTTDNYWGADIAWMTTGRGWVMILDDQGGVADFVVWGYSSEEIASLDVTINGFHVTSTDIWSGSAVTSGGTNSKTLQRRGTIDQNSADDWAFVSPASKGTQNAGLTVPFARAPFTLEPGERVVVVANKSAFRARYGTSARIAGQYTGRLDNNGERLALTDGSVGVIADFRYDDSSAWPGRADGSGFTLELIDPGAMPTTEPNRTAYLQDPNHWRSSSEYGGTPGAQGRGPVDSVVVNEVLTHSQGDWTDTIELFNPTQHAIDLSGWYLSDGSKNYRKFTVPDGTIIPAGGYVVFNEQDFNPAVPQPGQTCFALNGAHGDDVWLFERGQGGTVYFVDHVDYEAAAVNESLGRWPNGSGALYPMRWPTFETSHGQNAGPRVGPLIVSELSYQPSGDTPDDLEFVEIYNPLSTSVDLTDWRLAGGVDFDFPTHWVLNAHAVLVIVPFNPADQAKLAAFRSHYGIGSTVVVLGPYQGRLSDKGEKVRIERPDVPPPDDPTFIPHVLEDEVDYQATWFSTASGGGQSLVRLGVKSWGHSRSSFAAYDPTPGAYSPAAQVVAQHVFYNASVFDGRDAAPNAQDDAAIAPDKQALLPGQTATFQNYTSYSCGLNGIMIDVFDLADAAKLDAADFSLRIGNSSDVASWTGAPAPSSITVRPKAGVEGSDRVTLIWPDGVLQNTWIEVRMLPTANTGLSQAHVFYFGNAIGETGNSPSDAKVDTLDVLATRNHQRNFLNPAPIDFVFDFNRDGRVNSIDMLLARNFQSSSATKLGLITVPDQAGVAKLGKARDARQREAFATQLNWLSELEPIKPKNRSVSERSVQAAVDRVLAES